MIVPEHLPAVMQCQILGVPPPIISWTMNGQTVSNVSDRYILSNGSLFFSAPVNRLYAGQYVCSGTNSAGSISSGAVFFRVACKYYCQLHVSTITRLGRSVWEKNCALGLGRGLYSRPWHYFPMDMELLPGK